MRLFLTDKYYCCYRHYSQINAISKTEIPKTLLFSSLQTIAEATYLEIVAMGVAFGEEDYLGGVSVEICDLAGAIRQPDELHLVVQRAWESVVQHSRLHGECVAGDGQKFIEAAAGGDARIVRIDLVKVELRCSVGVDKRQSACVVVVVSGKDEVCAS